MLGKSRLDESVTLISVGTEIVGNLRIAHQLYLNGRVEGDISALEDRDATVIISETGSVIGDIRVPNVVISGSVEGNVYATGRVELAARAKVRGNVHYRLMEMQLGALVEGQLLHHDGAAVDASVPGSDSAAVGRPQPQALATEGGAPSVLKPVSVVARTPGT